MALDRWAPGWNERRAPDSLEVSVDQWVATKPRGGGPDPLARSFPEDRPVVGKAETTRPADPLTVHRDPGVDQRRAAWLREADEEESSR